MTRSVNNRDVCHGICKPSSILRLPSKGSPGIQRRVVVPDLSGKKTSGAFRLVAGLLRLKAESNGEGLTDSRFDDSHEAITVSNTFCHLDKNSAYFQVAVNHEDRNKP